MKPSIPLAPIPAETAQVLLCQPGSGWFLEGFTPDTKPNGDPDYSFFMSRNPEKTWAYRDARTIIGLAMKMGWFFIATELNPVAHPAVPGSKYYPPIYSGIHQ